MRKFKEMVTINEAGIDQNAIKQTIKQFERFFNMLLQVSVPTEEKN
jgi:hypothetical protein